VTVDRRIALVSAGGTISSVASGSREFVEYGASGRKVGPEELLLEVPEAALEATVLPLVFHKGNSLAIGEPEWLVLNRLLHDAAKSMGPLDGVVITHGTATMEQTAYFLSLTLKTAYPVVLVGAMRPLRVLGSDASINLVNATRLAASETAEGVGVVVMMNGQIHAAREVTKGATYSIEAFVSPNSGVLGHVDADGGVMLYARPTRRRAPNTEFDVRTLDALPRVGIAYSYAGADATVIEALMGSGVAGLVSAGHGAGSVTPREYEALQKARQQGLVVVLAGQAGHGRVLHTERRRQDGFVVAGNLNPLKARILLMLALTRTDDAQRIQGMFEEY